MADESLNLIITARDETSRVLDQVRGRVTGFGEELHRLERGGGQAFVQVGGAVERLAVQFTRVLDPALGGTVGRLSTLGTTFARTAGVAGGFATVLGTTVVAGAAVAGLGLNQYIGTLSQLSQEQAKTNALIDAMDFGGLAGRAQGLTGKMRELQATFSTWQAVSPVGVLNQIGGALDRVLGSVPSDFVRRFGTDRTAIEAAAKARADAGAGITALVPGELARVQTRSRIQTLEATGVLAGGLAQEALGARDVGQFLARMDQLLELNLSTVRANEERIRQEAAQRLAQLPPEARPVLEAETEAQINVLRAQSAVREAGILRSRSAGAETIGQALSAGELDLSRIPPIVGTEADAGLAERQRGADLAHLDVLRQRADLLGQLTPELQAQLTLQELQVGVQGKTLTEGEKVVVAARAHLAMLEQQAATNPVAGLAAGFSEVATRSRALGTELRGFAQDTSAAMGRYFSDNFFNLFTGRKGEDLGKQFGESLLRSVTDLVGRQLSGAVAGLFSQALGGGRGSGFNAAAGGGGDLLSFLSGAPGGSPILSPTGAAAGSLVMTQGGLAQVMPSGALQAVGGGGVGLQDALGLGSGLNSLSGELGGPTLGLAGAGASYLSAVAATPLSAIAQFGFTTAVAQTQAGLALAASGGPAFASFGGGTTFAVAGATAGAPLTNVALSAATSAGSTVGGALTGVLAAAALAFTIHSGLTQEQTAQNIALNAISGAISGAVLGAVIGGPWGALIGAIAGGAIAGGTTGIKAPRKPSASDRSRRVSAAAADNLAGALDQAASVEDLVTIFNGAWAPNEEVLIGTWFEGAWYSNGQGGWTTWAAGEPATPVVMVIPEFLDALQIRVGPTGETEPRQDLIDKFRAKRDTLLGILSNIPFGLIESDRAAGITRRTYQPLHQLYGLAPGEHQLFASSQLIKGDLGADDNTFQFIWNRLREVGQRRQLIDLSRDDFLSGLTG